jgi:hypothetical protein
MKSSYITALCAGSLLLAACCEEHYASYTPGYRRYGYYGTGYRYGYYQPGYRYGYYRTGYRYGYNAPTYRSEYYSPGYRYSYYAPEYRYWYTKPAYRYGDTIPGLQYGYSPEGTRGIEPIGERTNATYQYYDWDTGDTRARNSEFLGMP